jgi:hypothetical protein
MAKIPTAKSKLLLPTKGESLADFLSNLAIVRGLYYTALYDKVGENLKIFSASIDEEFTDVLWVRTAIQGHIIKLRVLKDDLLDFIDGNGQTLDIPERLKL